MIAMAFIANTIVGLTPAKLTAIPTGTKTKSIFMILDSNISLVVW